uniref:Uncharacterized protein n=1 Tax=Siphoviridae sp. ct2D011 TaxID=2825314 RepID=A0A8S5V995_9CAUD|nr:MAG TPA: hypothetical protein [Siphoviridae sp. ct2D011]
MNVSVLSPQYILYSSLRYIRSFMNCWTFLYTSRLDYIFILHVIGVSHFDFT